MINDNSYYEHYNVAISLRKKENEYASKSCITWGNCFRD